MAKEEKKTFLAKIVERKPPLYWWALLNVTMACLAIMSWLYFLPTFNYPEDPQHYERMIALGRPPQLPAYTAESAPKGSTINPETAHQIFTSSELSDKDLTELNSTFLRNYIQGIKLEKFNYYLKGDFQITRTRPLEKSDMFQDGIVIEAKAMRQIGASNTLVPFLVKIEYILPGANSDDLEYFPTGKNIQLHRIPHFSTIIHVHRNTAADGETEILLTLAPLVTIPPLHLSKTETITLKTPKRIYPAKKLPLFNSN